MNKKTKRAIVIAAAVVLLTAAAVIIFLVVRTNSAGYRNISIAEIFGRVITKNGGKTYEAYKNMRLADGYELTTDPDSYTRMILDDDKYVKLEQESYAVFEALGDSKRHLTTIRLEKGALTTEITKPLSETESYVVNTPNAVLAVRGTMFRVEVKQDENGDYYCDVYTFGGTVVSRRKMPDGTLVDESVEISAGYKATIKMDEVITVYLEEKIEVDKDNVDPINISDVNDPTLVNVYNAAYHGHDMFITTSGLWDEILRRGIDLSKYKSIYDGTKIPEMDYGNGGTSAGESVTESSDSTESSYEKSDSSDSSSSTVSSEGTLRPVSSSTSSEETHEPVAEPETSSSAESTESSSTASVSQPVISSSSSATTSSVPETPSVEHTHTLTTTTTEPTCTQSGSKIVKCETCGETISEVTLPPRGHNHVTETVTPATCTEEGEEMVKCSVCGGQLGRKTVPALGHTEVTSTSSATCTESGKTIVKCKVCNALLKETVIPAKGHSFGEYISDNNATCQQDGTKTAVCKVCGVSDTITDKGSILPHTPETVTVPSTCTEHGSETVICEVCETIITPEKELPLAEHTEVTETVDPTCTEDGKTTVKCSVCNETLNETVIQAKGHTEVTKTTDPTCTVDGKTTVTCSVCNETLREDIIPATGHSFGEYISDNNATCQQDGTKTAVCKVCGESDTITDKGSILPHTPETVTVPSTCTEHGSETVICEVCETIITPEKELPLAEHTEVTETVDPTCTEDGKTTVTCSVCGEIIDETVIAALGHDYEEKITKPASCTEAGEKIEACSRCDEERPGSLTVIEKLPHSEITEEANGISTVKCEICGEIITQTNLATGITYPIKISNIFPEPVPQSIADSDTNNDGKLSLDECRAVTELSFGEGETTGDILEQLVIFPALANINITVMITDGNLSIGSIGGLNDTNISNVTGGTYPSDAAGVIKDIIAGTEIECDYTMEGGKTIPVKFVPAEGSTFAPEDVAINEENFPDEKFRTYVSINFDKDSNGELSQEECEAVTSINVSGTESADGGYTSLKGVENFGKLQTLRCYYNSGLKELDVSKNTALMHLNCSLTQIASLDVSKNTALTNLYCYNISITSLDVSKNTALKELYCYNTQIESLDVSNNIALTLVYCSNTKITSLDVSKNTALTVLWCYNTQIASLDVSKNTALTKLYCFKTQIDDLDVSNNVSLAYLECYNTQITSLDVSKNTALKELHCYDTQITSLDVSKNTELKVLRCENTQIPFVDISNCTKVSTFNADGCEPSIHVVDGVFDLKSIDGFDASRIVGTVEGMDENGVLTGITEGTNITYTYDCKGTGESAYQAEFTLVPDEDSTFAPETPSITYPVAIDEEHFPDEKFREYVSTNFDTDKNGILSLEECDKVTEISVNGSSSSNDGGITSLKGVENFSKLQTLKCYYNSGLTVLDVSSNTALEELYCSYTQITSLDVSNNTALTNLNCGCTQIDSLNVNNNTALTVLSCGGTQIDSLDVSKNTVLMVLQCHDTQITSLDVSQNTALQTLWCYNCKLPFVDVSANATLSTLDANLNRYPIPTGSLSFDATNDPNFANFNPNRISNVQGADFNPTSGIFDNFTSNTVTYEYDCGNGFVKTFTLVRTAEAAASLDGEDNGFAALSDNTNDTTPPPDSADMGGSVNEDAALPPNDTESLRYLPLGILALKRDRKRKKLYVRRKAEI